MIDPQSFEFEFQEYIKDLSCFVPDGIYEVNLALLYDLGLLKEEEETYYEEEDSSLSYSFYVIESEEKLTLYNQQFVVWIVPQVIDQVPTTYTLIALNEPEKTHLEMVFTTSGVYNHSGLVLRVLESFLNQIDENEEEICKIKSDEK